MWYNGSMARYPSAVWRPLPENSHQGNITPTQVILHTAVDAPGPTSLYPFFARGDVSVESHFFVKFDGTVEQYMDTTVRADANRLANSRAISIETEDDGSPAQWPWTAAQVEALVDLILWISVRHGIPLERCPRWDQPGIGYHSMWGAPSPWTPAAGKTCPGSVRIRQFNDIILPRLRGRNTTGGFLMALTDEEQQEVLTGIRNMTPTLVRRAGTTYADSVCIWFRAAGVKIPLRDMQQVNAFKELYGLDRVIVLPAEKYDLFTTL